MKRLLCLAASMLFAAGAVAAENNLKAASNPLPVCKAARGPAKLATGSIDDPAWHNAARLMLNQSSATGAAATVSGTELRVLYNSEALYLRFDAPFTELTVFEPARLNSERLGLWDRDVLEAFIGTDPKNERVYYEFEVAPTGEKLDLKIAPEIPDTRDRLDWNSGWETWSKADPSRHVWTAVMRIPLRALSTEVPHRGTRWRMNLYRIDRANRAFLAWSPTFKNSFHVPARFGWLEFAP